MLVLPLVCSWSAHAAAGAGGRQQAGAERVSPAVASHSQSPAVLNAVCFEWHEILVLPLGAIPYRVAGNNQQVVNEMAMQAVLNNLDRCTKNFLMYRWAPRAGQPQWALRSFLMDQAICTEWLVRLRLVGVPSAMQCLPPGCLCHRALCPQPYPPPAPTTERCAPHARRHPKTDEWYRCVGRARAGCGSAERPCSSSRAQPPWKLPCPSAIQPLGGAVPLPCLALP